MSSFRTFGFEVVFSVFTLHMDRSRRYFGSGAAGLCAEGNRIMVIPKYRSGESDFLHSSLWQYWGSPYGNPADGMYTIHDPYFQSSGKRRVEDEVSFYVPISLYARSVPTIRSATALNPNTADYVFEVMCLRRCLHNLPQVYAIDSWRRSMDQQCIRILSLPLERV